MKIKFIPFISSLVAPFLVGGVGSFFTTPSLFPWYSSLNKPFFNPPNWIFGPVWTTLYLLMGVSLYLYWTGKGKNKKTGYNFFSIQLFLNLLWSVFFFGFKSPILALFIILLMLMFIVLTMREFRKISQTSFYLLVPYISWVSFATILNASIIILN